MVGNIQTPPNSPCDCTDNKFVELMEHVAKQAKVPYADVFEAFNLDKKDCKVDTAEATLALDLAKWTVLADGNKAKRQAYMDEALRMHPMLFGRQPNMENIKKCTDLLDKYYENSPFPNTPDQFDENGLYKEDLKARRNAEFLLFERVYSEYEQFILQAIHQDRKQIEYPFAGSECT